MSETSVPVAFKGELMLAGWSETHTGGAKVTFWLPDAAALESFRSMTVRKGNTAGQRFMGVLVEVDESERPVAQQEAVTARPAAKGGPLARDAAIICATPAFQSYAARCLAAGHAKLQKYIGIENADTAAECMRYVCGIGSRAELDSTPEAARAFQRLMADYRAWARETGA